MAKNRFYSRKPLWRSAGFYTALVVCLLALGISSYSAVSRLRAFDTPSASSLPPVSSLAEVDNKVSNVPYPASEVSSPPADADTPAADSSVLAPPAPFFTLPVTGEILKEYDHENLQYSETFKDWRLHLGVDIAAEKGAPVLACAQGVVVHVYADAALGTVVTVDHGDGLVASYCGLNAKPTVAAGQAVESGQQIGVIDVIPVECVEQPHLHLEMERDGVPVSPLAVMNLPQ